jgi:hypothetical protein
MIVNFRDGWLRDFLWMTSGRETFHPIWKAGCFVDYR